MKGLIIRNKIVWIPIVVRYAKKCNKTPTRSELATQRHKKKWTDVRNIKWTKINKVTHVIRGQPFYILGEGVALNLTGSYRFSFSNDQIKTFTFIPSKKLQVKAKKMTFWKCLLNYSLSAGSPSFINYSFSTFWQCITLFSLWWRSNCLFTQQNED